MFLPYQGRLIRTRVSNESTFFSNNPGTALRKITISMPFRGIVAKIDFLTFITHTPDNVISLIDELGQISQWIVVNFSNKCSEQDSNNYCSLDLHELRIENVDDVIYL
jgi:hypothetical protein